MFPVLEEQTDLQTNNVDNIISVLKKVCVESNVPGLYKCYRYVRSEILQVYVCFNIQGHKNPPHATCTGTCNMVAYFCHNLLTELCRQNFMLNCQVCQLVRSLCRLVTTSSLLSCIDSVLMPLTAIYLSV